MNDVIPRSHSLNRIAVILSLNTNAARLPCNKARSPRPTNLELYEISNKQTKCLLVCTIKGAFFERITNQRGEENTRYHGYDDNPSCTFN